MGALAEKLFEVVQAMPAAERRELLRLIAAAPGTAAVAATPGAAVDLPEWSGGEWRAGDLGRDEIYSDEARHAMPD